MQDLASAHVNSLDYLLNFKGKHFFNVGTGNGLSVLEIINAFEKANNTSINYIIGPRRNGDIEKIYSDGTLIKNTLGWIPKRTIKDALISEYKWQKIK